MKKLLTIALLLALVSALALSACAEGGDALSRIRERGTLVIATEGNWQPWTYHDENDVLTGFDVEIGTLLAEGLGVQPEFQETAWDAILAGVDAGRFDIACNGVGYTETRAEKYSFSTPYVYTEIVLVVKGDNDAINTVEDLNGKTTANTASSTYAAIGEGYGATVTPVSRAGWMPRSMPRVPSTTTSASTPRPTSASPRSCPRANRWPIRCARARTPRPCLPPSTTSSRRAARTAPCPPSPRSISGWI